MVQDSLRQTVVDARVTEAAARQRMLSQRIAKAALILIAPGTGTIKWDHRAELRRSEEEWEAVHVGLVRGTADRGLPGQPSPRIAASFREIEPWFHLLDDGARAVSAILGAEGAYLKAAETITRLYKEQENSHLLALQRTQVLLTPTVLSIVLLLGLLVFRSAQRRILESVYEFLAVAAEVERRAAELQKSNTRLDHALDGAQTATRLKSEFLANLSHEIRTPMYGVLGMTSLRLDTPLDHERRDWAETIRSSGESLLRIINDILDFSRVEAGRLTLEAVALDPRALLETAVGLLASSLRRIASHCRRRPIPSLSEPRTPLLPSQRPERHSRLPRAPRCLPVGSSFWSRTTASTGARALRQTAIRLRPVWTSICPGWTASPPPGNGDNAKAKLFALR